MRHKLKEFLIDPSSGQYSMSRFGLGFITCCLFPAALALEAIGLKTDCWTALAALAGSLATVYAVNSGAGAWKRRQGENPDG